MRHSLVINGIDYNTELDLLSKYTNQNIYNGCGISIDVGSLPKDINPLELIKLWRQTGVLLCPSRNNVEFTKLEPLTFEIWKRDLNPNN